MDKKEKFQRGREAKQRRQARLSCHWKRDWIISGLGRGPGCVWKSKLALTLLSPCLLCKDNFLLVVWICRSSSPSQKVDLAAAKRVRNLWSSVIALDIWHERRRSHKRLRCRKGLKDGLSCCQNGDLLSVETHTFRTTYCVQMLAD